MTAFPPLTDWPDALELPVRGRDGVTRTYRIKDLSASEGVAVDQLVSRAAKLSQAGQDDAVLLDDEEEAALHRRVLGAEYERLSADVASEELRRVVMAVFVWVVSGQEAALRFWRGEARV